MLSPAERFVQVSARKPKDEQCDLFGPSLPLLSFTCWYLVPVCLYKVITRI